MKAVNLEPIREFWQSRFPKSVNVQIHTDPFREGQIVWVWEAPVQGFYCREGRIT